MTRDSLRAVNWFPLVPRPRPAGRPLAERVAELVDTAEVLGEETAQAARVFNGAALLASDTGSSELARLWCWRHATTYLDSAPLDAPTARLALEPLVNLARLRIRSGHGMAAYHLIDTLHHAVHHASDAEIDGNHVRLDRLTLTRAQREQVARWLWTIRLGDGLRALASAGAWAQAATEAERHGGVGKRLLDGRQICIVARCLDRDADAALDMVQASSVSQPWEYAVQSCLQTLCGTRAKRPSIPAAETMKRRFLALISADTPIVFHARLGLAVLDLAENVEGIDVDEVFTLLIDETVRVADGYAAREILTAQKNALTAEQRAQLGACTAASGLHGSQSLTPHLPHLTCALDKAEEAIRALASRSEQPRPG
jgi:hypothetical protein